MGVNLQALSSSLSDHCPLFLCNLQQPHRMAVFKFEQFWIRVPGFLDIVQAAWSMPVRGTSPLMILHNRLQNTRKSLLSWSRSLFSDARIQLHMANEVILRLDTAQESRTLSDTEVQLQRELKHHVLGWAAIERARRRQSSRVLNLKEGDACTKFFHQKANGRRKRNMIAYLRDDTGEFVWKHAEKEQLAFSYFHTVLGTKSNRGCTLDWDSMELGQIEDTLDQAFSLEEIKAAMDDLPMEKAPGPDGFTGGFYKKCWEIIKYDLLAAMASFHGLRTGPLDALNEANIVLIPKAETAEQLKDFRPISLIHSFAKLVTKILSRRLSSQIHSLVSNSQSAFIKHRCIQDNFLYVRNLARAYHRTKTPALLFKLDISKAFDTVSWEYMLELLEHRGFSSRWRDWLSMLFKTSHSKVLLNGVAGRRIKHARGLRQGDPLSPYLFILAIDTLQRVLEIATMEGVLSPLRGRHARLRLSLYADDAVIFINPVQSEVTALFSILGNFGEATGLKLNLEKCMVAPIRCSELNLDSILETFTGRRVGFPLTYLGLPLTLGRLKVVHVQKVVDTSRSRLAGWQGKLLNIAGRRELVRSVLSSIPIYLLTALKAPKQLFQEIDKVRRRFLWASDSELTGGKCKVAWTLVARPTDFGGLGILDLERFSRALRLRWLWFHWRNPERPWNGTELPADSTDINLFNAATTVTVHNGRRASFWLSSWLDGQAPSRLCPLLFKHSQRKNRSVRDAIVGGLLDWRYCAQLDTTPAG